MTFGLTINGWVSKRLADIKLEIETALREKLGNGINLLPTAVLGQIVGIWAEREALIWEGMKAVYDSQSPDTADGAALDNVVSITGIKRLEATKGTGTITAFGTLGTIITVGSIVSVNGNADARFATTEEGIIAAGTNEVQDIDFSAVPDAGQWTLRFDGQETGTLAFNDNAAAVQAALNGLNNLSAVTVGGNYAAGFTVTFAGADGSIDQPMLQVGANTLTNTGVQVNMSIVETTPGVLPNVDIPVEAETAGEIAGYSGTLTIIETPIAGWDSVTNELDIDAGKNIETDAELRLRRLQTLATSGSTTVDAIRARILEIDEVVAAKVFENDGDVPDGAGRPAHSFEAVVLGGEDQEIWDTIWANKAAGIKTFGGENGTVVDTQGYSHSINFSRPGEVPIYMIVNLTTDANYPVDGDNAVKQAIADYATAEFSIGDDVLQFKLFSAIEAIEGIIEAEILIDDAPAPTLEDPITIADDEIATFDTANITVNS